MRLSRIPTPRKVKIIPKKILDALTLKEKAIFIVDFLLRKNIKVKGFRVKFFKHKN